MRRNDRLSLGGASWLYSLVSAPPSPGLDLAWALEDGAMVDLFTLLPDRAPSDAMRALSWYVIGRLRRDVTPGVAQARMLPVAVDVFRTVAQPASSQGPNVVSIVPRPPSEIRIVSLHEVLFGRVRPFVRLLLASGTLLVLIACAGAGGTMVMVSSQRARDAAIQQALGRSSRHIRRGLLLEGLGLGLLAGAIACFVARLLMSVVVALGPSSIPRIATTELGWFEIAVAGLVAAGCGLVTGLIPASTMRLVSFHALREGAAATMVPGCRSRSVS